MDVVKLYTLQGFNRLAAIALLFLEEEDAFWCLVAVINIILPKNYFCCGMQGAHMDQVGNNTNTAKFKHYPVQKCIDM